MKKKFLLFASIAILLIFLLTGCPNVPKNFTLTVTTQPDVGLTVRINDNPHASPKSITVGEGSSAKISVDTPQEKDTSAFVAGDDTRYTFIQWNDASTVNPRNVTVNSDVTYTAQMRVEYKVATSSNPTGAAVTGSGWYTKNSNATLTAPVRAGYTFSHWSVNGAYLGSTNPLVIAVDTPKNVVANYNSNAQYTLTLTTLPDLALDVRIDAVKYLSPKNMLVPAGSSKSIAVDTPQEKDISNWLTGNDARYAFINWNDASTVNPRNVTVNSDVTYTANMDTEYRVDFGASPTLIETSTEWFEKDIERGFDFQGDFGTYSFSHWLVNGQNYGSERPLMLTIDKPYKIIGVFVQEQAQYTLTVTTSPQTGLNILIGGINYTSPKSVVLNSGTTTSIRVVSPQEKDNSGQVTGTDTRYTFLNWNDSNTENPRNVVVNSDMTYTAQMRVEYKVTTSSNPVGVTVPGAGWYVSGSIVNFSAPSRDGYTFDHWSVNGVDAGMANPLSQTVNEPKNIIAHYVPAAGRNIWGDITPYTGNVKTAGLEELKILSNPEIRSVPEGRNYVEGEYLLKVSSFKEIESSLMSFKSLEIRERIESYDGELKYLLVKTNASIDTLRTLPGVLEVSRNYLFYPMTTTPNDPRYPLQWNYPLINMPQAWDYTIGSRSVVVAVIDSGFSVDHPDLDGVFVEGYNFEDNNTDVSESATAIDSHGTHVAGTIAALTNNSLGVAGVTWGGFGISLIPVKGLRDAAMLVNSLLYAVDHGAKIINMSLAGSGDSAAVHDAVRYAHRNGVVIVAASGNTGGSVLYPAKYSETIAVGAVWSDEGTIKRPDYSCYGPELDVVAPGGYMKTYTDPNGIYSTAWTPTDGDTYMYLQGTSMATPHVTGLVALLMGAGLTDPAEIRSVLRSTAIDLGDAGRDDYYGHGMVDAQAALAAITTPQPFKVFLRNPATGVDIAQTTLADSGAYGFEDVALAQVKVWAWRDMDESGAIDTGDLLGYYNYAGGRPNLNNAQTVNLTSGDNWIDFQFAPIVDD